MPSEIYTCVCGKTITGKENWIKHRKRCPKAREEDET